MHWYVTGNKFHERRLARSNRLPTSRQLFAKVGRRRRAIAMSSLTRRAGRHRPDRQRRAGAALSRSATTRASTPSPTTPGTGRCLAQPGRCTQGLSDSADVLGQRLLPQDQDHDLQRRHQRRFARPVGLPAQRRRAGGTGGRRLHGLSDQRGERRNTPFPKWRCIANALLLDEPNEKCNGLINQTRDRPDQLRPRRPAQRRRQADGPDQPIVVGAAYDASRVPLHAGRRSSATSIRTARSPVFGAFADGVKAGLSTKTPTTRASICRAARSTGSVYAHRHDRSRQRTHLTLSGRYNHTSVTNSDAHHPGRRRRVRWTATHTFSRFNPAIGLTLRAERWLTAYVGANQGSRAPSSIELGCADPANPCKLPNCVRGRSAAQAGRHHHVRSRRARRRGRQLRLEPRRVPLGQQAMTCCSSRTTPSGFGYFKNFGKTRRQGIEMGLSAQARQGLDRRAAT